jgi:hypothetical protein
VKVLFTGSTASQVGSTRRPNAVLNFGDALNWGFKQQGHRVTWVKPDPELYLDDYDLIMVGITPPNAMGATYWTQAALLLQNAMAKGMPTKVWVDDWRIKEILAGFGTYYRNPDNIVK